MTKEAHYSAIEITLHRHNDIANFAVNTFLNISGSVFPVRCLSVPIACTHAFVIKLGPMSGMWPWRTWEGAPSAFSTGDLISRKTGCKGILFSIPPVGRDVYYTVLIV